MTEKKVKNGRPPKYKPEFDDIAKRLCEAGATDEEIAEMLKIGRTTFYRWRNEHPTFRYALKIGKASADDRVEQSLYQKALGAHVVEEEQAFRLKDKDGNERVEIVKVRKGMPADTTAAIFWLKNRRRREWQDAQVVQHELPLASEVAEAMGKIDDDL